MYIYIPNSEYMYMYNNNDISSTCTCVHIPNNEYMFIYDVSSTWHNNDISSTCTYIYLIVST